MSTFYVRAGLLGMGPGGKISSGSKFFDTATATTVSSMPNIDSFNSSTPELKIIR